jgi:hypothetical protein
MFGSTGNVIFALNDQGKLKSKNPRGSAWFSYVLFKF